jgi:hypothetical protein
VGCCIGYLLVRRVGGIVPKRGMGIRADLGELADKPRVRVREVAKAGPARVRLVLTPEPGPADVPLPTTSSDLELVVSGPDQQFGFELLCEWQRSQSVLAVVMPPDSRIVRLRSIDDLQPLTLRRVD